MIHMLKLKNLHWQIYDHPKSRVYFKFTLGLLHSVSLDNSLVTCIHHYSITQSIMLLLLLSHVSCVRLCATPLTAAHQAPLSLGFSRQGHWSGLPFPSPMHKSESEVAQSCPTLRDPMDCSLPDSSVHGIFQARVLEWVAIAFSNRVL